MAAERERDEQQLQPTPVIQPGLTYRWASDKISSIVLTPDTPRGWLIGFTIAFVGLLLFAVSVLYLLLRGPGIWGIRIPIGWGFAIANYVWWIEIAVGGSILSSYLLLVRAPWRRSIDRFAESMTLAGFVCAGVYPLLHLGRPWLFYWLVPYPNPNGLWPQFRSALFWDFTALTAYGGVTALIWYVGLLPDLATMRDKARFRPAQYFFAILAQGWRGSARDWHHHEKIQLLLAAVLAPTVVGIHSVASLDFAVSLAPGWHSTIFPPYFIAAAVLSGLAMVLMLAVAIRAFYGLEALITVRHLDFLARLMLGASLFLAYYYVEETFTTWYSGDAYEIQMLATRLVGPYAPIYWLTILLGIVAVQAFWFKRVRNSPWTLFGLAIVINIGMWLDRYFLVVNSLSKGYLPASWGVFVPTFWDFSTFVGSIGLFFFIIFIFSRLLPLVPIAEVQELISLHKRSGDEPGRSEGGPPASPPAPARRPAPELPPGSRPAVGK